VGGDIEFLGFVSGEPLWKLVREARAMVLPSEWYENAPMSALEAYACGKPVLGARIGGIPEMVREGEIGALFVSGNVEELTGLLARFAAMPDEQISAMGQAARVYVASTFTAVRYLREMLSLYADLGVQMNAPEQARGGV
jgi:glycosyltransferase involved in cell wall biosynthesis